MIRGFKKEKRHCKWTNEFDEGAAHIVGCISDSEVSVFGQIFAQINEESKLQQDGSKKI